MTDSPARRHRLALLAGAASIAMARTAASPAPVQSRMWARLQADILGLKQIKSVQAKIARKAVLLPEYAPYVKGVLAADAGGDDRVVAHVMVWRLDVGDWAGGLDVAAYALRHGLTLPERFKSDLPTFVLEAVADAALTLVQDGNADGEIAGALDRAMNLTEGRDMPDEVRAKAHKAAGLLRVETDPETALAHLQTALRLNRASGVKTAIEKLAKQLAKVAVPDTAAGAGDAPPADGQG